MRMVRFWFLGEVDNLIKSYIKIGGEEGDKIIKSSSSLFEPLEI